VVEKVASLDPVSEGLRPSFAEVALPHLDAAYNLAHWLTRNDIDAADVVQEACLRALTYFDGYRGENGRAWLLTIVRNTCHLWIQRNRPATDVEFSSDVENEVENAAIECGKPTPVPEAVLLQEGASRLLNELIAALPHPFREVLVLRELEDMSYREISDVLGMPTGTIMSRLARARGLLKDAWARRNRSGANHGM